MFRELEETKATECAIESDKAGCEYKLMSSAIDELTAKFRQTCEESGENEQRVIDRLTQRLHISRNVNREYEEALTLGQRLADRRCED